MQYSSEFIIYFLTWICSFSSLTWQQLSIKNGTCQYLQHWGPQQPSWVYLSLAVQDHIRMSPRHPRRYLSSHLNLWSWWISSFSHEHVSNVSFRAGMEGHLCWFIERSKLWSGSGLVQPWSFGIWSDAIWFRNKNFLLLLNL